MASKYIEKRYTSGSTVYLAVFRKSDGKVFDWADNTWKLDGSATTPNVAMSALRSAGTGQSLYVVSLNLATINATATPVDVTVLAFKRVGGSVSLANDEAISEPVGWQIAEGDLVTEEEGGPQVKTTVSVTSTAGNNAHVKVQLVDSTGTLIDLDALDPAATCAVQVIRDGNHAQFSLSTSDFGAPNGAGWFEADYANPNFTADRGYTVLTTVIAGGVTYSSKLATFHVVP